MTRIAFLGTGVMGVGMARRLMAAGHNLSVFNRTVEKTRPLVEQGALSDDASRCRRGCRRCVRYGWG